MRGGGGGTRSPLRSAAMWARRNRRPLAVALVVVVAAGVLAWVVRWAYIRSLDPATCLGEILQCAEPIFVRHQLDIWMDAGSLLGTVRHGGFIPWDNPPDIDMMIRDADGPRLKAALRDIALECGFPAIHRDDVAWLPAVTSYVIRRNVGRIFYGRLVPIYLDVADDATIASLDPYRPYGFDFPQDILDAPIYADENFPVHYRTPIPHSYIFPLRPCLFEGVHARCPARSEDVLELLFGPTWRVPDVGAKPIHSLDSKVTYE